MKKKRKETPETEPKVKLEGMSYRVFFHECLARGLVKSWQEREIHAFFRDLGLTDKESSDTYKIALDKY